MAQHRRVAKARTRRRSDAPTKTYAVTDDLDVPLPVTAVELDLLERYIGDALDKFLQQEAPVDENV